MTALYEIEFQRGVDLDDRDEIGVVSRRGEDPERGVIMETDEDIDREGDDPGGGSSVGLRVVGSVSNSVRG